MYPAKSLPLAEILSYPVLTVTAADTVRTALALMRTRRLSALVVVDGERPLGIVTERDAVLLASRHADTDTVRVAEVMGQPPLLARPDMDYRDAYRLISDCGVRHLIVVDEVGRLAGIVTEGDFLDHLGFEYLVRFKEVGAVMTRDVLTLPEGASLEEAVQLMAGQAISCVVVVGPARRPLGILTERDVVRLAQESVDQTATPLAAVMSRPIQSVSANDPLELTVKRMSDSRIRRLVVVDADGRLSGLVTRHDLTKILYSRHIEHLQQTVAELRAELARDPDRLYRYLLEHSADAVLVSDVREGRILRANEQACRQLGCDIDTLLSRRVVEFSRFYEAASWPEQVARYRREGRVVVETEHLRPQGAPLPVEVSVRYVEGEPEDYLVAIVRDISERKAAERLKEDRERYFRDMERIAAVLSEGDIDAVLAALVREVRAIFAADRVWLLYPADPQTPSWQVPVEDAAADYPGAFAAGLQVPMDDLAASVFAAALASKEPVAQAFDWELAETPHWIRDFSIRSQLVVALRPQGDQPWLLGMHQCGRARSWSEDERRLLAAIGQRTADVLGRLILTRRLQEDIVARQRSQDELAEREMQLRTLIEALPDAVSFKDGEGRWLVANSVNIDQFGLAAQEWRGLKDEDIARLHPDQAASLAACRASDEAAWASRAIYRTEEVLAGADGRGQHFDVVKVPLFNADGSRRALVVIGRDITARRRAEEGLRQAASVFRSTHEGITITDAEGTILDVNDAFCRITGYGRDEVLGRNTRLLKSGQHDDDFYAAMWMAIRGAGYWSGEIWNRRKDGSIYPELLTISAVRDEAGAIAQYVAAFTDITVIKQHEKQLERIAHFDALTGVPNRVLLADRMQQAIAQTRRDSDVMAVGYLDLDGFKPINDRFGHEVGDRLLVEVARRLKNTLRQADTVARLGGDEFVVLLLGLQQVEECALTLDRVLEVITEPIHLDGQLVSISASIGATLFPIDDADPDTLLRHADQAMYAAKQGGRNRYHLYDPEHDRRARSHHEAFSRIKRALAGQEFELHYQPKVNMRLGTVVGAEALIRWRHPQRGLLAPAEFLPVVESSELEIEIGNWVLRTALAQAAEWQAGGLELQIGVNIAASHLQRADFAAGLAAALARQPGVRPAQLQLEVLETAALEDMARVSETMAACRALGVSFALDDFGTGYSSLTYLKRLPAEVLKIDQSFVRDMLEDPEDRAIVEGVIALTLAFGRTPVAEGVETAEQGLLLLRHGCELAQGYGIARPMAAALLPAWVRDWRPDPRWTAAVVAAEIG